MGMYDDETAIGAEREVFELTDMDWYGQVYRWNKYMGEPAEPGDHVSGRSLTPIDKTTYRDEDDVLYLVIPSCFIDGIHHDVLGRSNFERVLEDFEEFVIRADWTYTDELLVRVGSEVPADLIRVIEGLRNYPVYDEEDYSRREWEEYEQYVGEMLDFVVSRYEKEQLDHQSLPEGIELTARERVLEWLAGEDGPQWYRAEEVDDRMMYEQYTQAADELSALAWQKLARDMTGEQYAGMDSLDESD